MMMHGAKHATHKHELVGIEEEREREREREMDLRTPKWTGEQ